MSFRSPLRNLLVANPTELATAIGSAVPVPPSASAIGAAVPQAIDIGGGVNARTPWESGQLPVSLSIAAMHCTSTTGNDQFASWNTSLSSFNLGPITLDGAGKWVVPNGYRFRLTGLLVTPHDAGATGYAGIKPLAGSSDYIFQLPYHAPNNSSLALTGYELPGGTGVAFHVINYGTAMFMDATLLGVCYLP